MRSKKGYERDRIIQTLGQLIQGCHFQSLDASRSDGLVIGEATIDQHDYAVLESLRVWETQQLFGVCAYNAGSCCVAQ